MSCAPCMTLWEESEQLGFTCKLLGSSGLECNKRKIMPFGEADSLCALPFGMTFRRRAACGMDTLHNPTDKFSLQQLSPLFRSYDTKIQ